MSTLARGAVVGLGALAVYQLSEPAAATKLGPVQSPGEAPARQGLASSPVCEAELAGDVGGTFAAELVRQARALSAQYGGFTLPFVGTVPILPARCCAEWIERWLKALEALHARDSIRFNFGGIAYSDAFRLPSGGIFNDFWDAFPGLPGAWRAVLKDYEKAKAAGDATPYLHAGAVATDLRRLADVLDAQARVSLSPSAGEYVVRFISFWGDTTKAIASTTGNALAWVVEELAAPTIGAVAAPAVGAATSALAPYLIIVGVGYLAWRKLS